MSVPKRPNNDRISQRAIPGATISEPGYRHAQNQMCSPSSASRLATLDATKRCRIVCWLASRAGLARERRASPNGANDRSDRSAAEGRVVLIFEERFVRRALRRLMSAVRREGRQLVLGSGPSRLLAKIGRQDEERLPIEARESLVLAEDGS